MTDITIYRGFAGGWHPLAVHCDISSANAWSGVGTHLPFRPMLSPTAATIRLVLHVLAACVWVGGQLALGGIVPAVRSHPGATESGITRVIARAYNRIAWPAFAVLLLTGLWNLTAIDIGDTDTNYQVTVFLHVVAAALSGVFAGVHIIGTTKLALALGGALGLLGALAALFLGVLLRTGS